MSRIDTYILARSGRDGTDAKNQILKNRHFLCGSELLEEYDNRFHVITHPDQIRGSMVNPQQVHITGEFWSNPNCDAIVEQLRYVMAMNAKTAQR